MGDRYVGAAVTARRAAAVQALYERLDGAEDLVEIAALGVPSRAVALHLVEALRRELWLTPA